MINEYSHRLLFWGQVDQISIYLNWGLGGGGGGGWRWPGKKKYIRHSFSSSILKEIAVSYVNIGIKYHILLPASPLPQLHYFVREISYIHYQP